MSTFRKKPFRRKATLLAAALGIAAVAAGTVGTRAANDIVGEFDHFLSCFDFIINDEPRHRRNCTPNRSVPPFESLSKPVAGGPVPVSAPPTTTSPPT